MFTNFTYKRRLLKEAIKFLFRQDNNVYKVLLLDYPINPVPKYGYGHEPHKRIANILSENKHQYRSLLQEMLNFQQDLEDIPPEAVDETNPFWNNGFFPGLDALTLYCIISSMKPTHYFEVGSGNSTKFARKAINDHHLSTDIICIDPKPRANIETIADRIIHSTLESVDLSIFQELNSNDILFIDGSHRCFMNSDVTTVFLDILPELKKGVLIHFHDIFLPLDYAPKLADLFYSEQYLLAVLLLSTPKPDIVFPSFFVQSDPELMNILDPIVKNLPRTSFHGGSFWIRK
ncbi:MAG: class I SAM-dependent methyltransferase [Syntrophobacteraceae bacterium]